MIKRWRFIAAGIVAITLGFLYINNVQAKYAESKTLTVSVNIEKHYQVAFDANGGTGSMANQQFTSGVTQTLTANAYTYAGHYFDGWNTSADGNGTSYADEELISTDLTNVGGSVVTLYAQWTEDAMQTVFKIDGTCVFHGYDIQQGTGNGYITGTDCTAGGTNWADGTHKYIDSGIKLYDSTNYTKDYEVGFTITVYDPNNQYKEPGDSASQATFFSDKLENSSRHWPGIVVRKARDNIEITETITMHDGTSPKKSGSATSATPVKVVITRVDNVIYYSINGGAFTLLQDINDSSDYFDVNAWFGAAAKEDGTPMRYIDATMTDIYIKVGDTGANKHTVSFDAGGVVSDPSDVTVISSSKLGDKLPSMPNHVDTQDGRLYFIGWYSGIDGTGVLYDEDSVISSDITLHAFWNDELILCSINNGNTHGDLQDCIDEANTGDTITLLNNTRGHDILVDSSKDITLDLNGYTLSNDVTTSNPVITNRGKLTVINGTVSSAASAGVFNNEGIGELTIGNGARIIATGTRQGIYNDSAKLVISDGAYISATSSARATVQNHGNGQLIITGGTIISTRQEAVKVEGGTAVIGVEDGVADRTTPILQGATYGLNTSVDVSMFDGRLRGKTAAINSTARITATESGATSVGIDSVVTEVVDGVTYQIIYYQ